MSLKNIPKHTIFQYLNNLNETLKDGNKLLNLSTFYENELFIWNEGQLVINVICLKYSYLDNKENDSLKFYQELKLNNPPNFTIEHILCNYSGNYIALFGRNGICIVEKPLLTWTNNDNQASFKSYFCKSYLVDEHFFSTDEYLTILKWHPGSKYGQRFIFLTANNALRIYSIPNISEPVDVINLYGQSLSDSFSSLPTHQALGEICVSFDFGEMLDVEEVQIEGKQKKYKKMWPIYLLFENADIYEILVEFNNTMVKGTHILRGPLLMYPPAEDNYGSDACCILYISNKPPLLVIATQERRIYNCFLLGDEDDTSPLSQHTTKLLKMPAVPSLFVHERIDVELFFDKSQDLYSLSVPIQLYLDKNCANRYYVYHPTGIYSVFMPWLSKVKELIFSDGNNQNQYLDLNENSVVKHHFCSKPFNSSEGEFLVGFASTFDHINGCYSICLTNLFQCHFLQNIYVNDPPLAIELSNETFNSKSKSYDSLINKITNLFNKKSSIPILRGINSASPEDQFQLLCRITQVFREEYIQRFDLARIELEKNVQKILIAKKNQEDELHLLETEMSQMLKLKKSIENKLLLVVQTQKDNQTRMDDASSLLYKSISMLTNAEENMKNNLEDLKINISDVKILAQKLKTKHEKLNKNHFDQPLPLQSFNSQTKRKSFIDDKQKLATVFVCLNKEIEDISRLMNQAQRLKSILDI